MRIILLSILGVLMIGCASTNRTGGVDEATAPITTIDTEAPDPAPLANSAIPSGQCGMILWSQFGARTVPVFRSVGITKASMSVEGQPVDFVLARQSGNIRLGMADSQDFISGEQSENPVGAKVRLDWGQAFPGGSYVQRGTLTVSGADGWERVMPVAGIAGCKA